MFRSLFSLLAVVGVLLQGCTVSTEGDLPDISSCKGQRISCDGTGNTIVCIESPDPAEILEACGGDCPPKMNCDPQVFTTDIKLVSKTQLTVLKVSGRGLAIPNLQIVIYTETSSPTRKKRDVEEDVDVALDRRKRSTYTVREMAEIVNVTSSSEMYIAIHRGLEKGEYILGPRIGIQGEEYENSRGAVFYVYAESDFTTSAYSPAEVNLGQAGISVDITFTTVISDNSFLRYSGRTQMFGIISDSADIYEGNVIIKAAKTFSPNSNNIVIDVEMPSESKELWVCLSVNGQLDINCKSVKFYVVAPVVIDRRARFSDNGGSLELSFNNAVDTLRNVACTDIFTDTSSFGDGTTCKFNPQKTKMKINLGDLSTVKPADKLTIKAGLIAASGTFRREMTETEVTVVGIVNIAAADSGQEGDTPPPPSILDVSPRGFWPRELTGCALSPLTLGIVVGLSTSGRQPESIVWSVNDVVQEAASGQLQIDVDVATPGTYNIKVVVTDFLGGSTTLTHSVIKNTLPVPDATFTPQRLRPLVDGTFGIHPGEVFGIGTRIAYKSCLDGHSEGLDDFHFNWTRNDQSVEGRYFYKSDGTENTIAMCGDVVRYKLKVIRKADVENFQETHLDVTIQCRNPVARIIGNSYNEIAVTYPERVAIDGRFSYDPDRGQLTYIWTCVADGQDCSRMLGLTSSLSRPVLMFRPSSLEVGVAYRFTLQVSVAKSDRTYTATSFVQYTATGGTLPTVRILTQQNNFRRNVRILLKANVTVAAESYNMTAQWRFVPDLDDYEWYDLSGSDDVNSNILTDYTWYTIPKNTLTVGKMYKMRLTVTLNNNPAQATSQDHDIYIYQPLRRCEIKARDITELQKTQILLQNCITDPAYRWLETTCELHGKKLQSTDDLTFNIPIFKDRTITRVNFTCEVRDGLGHTLTVVSNEVAVTLLSADELNQVLQDRITDETLKGNKVDMLELRASKIENDGAGSKRSDQREMLKLLKDIRKNDPDARDLKRALKSVTVVQPDKMNKKDRKAMAHQISRTIKTLGNEDGTEQAARFSTSEIKEVLDIAKRIVTEDKYLRNYYREIIQGTACLLIKAMKNDEKVEMDLGEGGKQTVAVLTLDDAISENINIPNDLKDRFRTLWQCTSDDVCDDVAMATEEYPSDPPDLQTGRPDRECAKYVTLDIINPKTCKNIPVRNNFEPIEIKITSECVRPKCYYYEEVTESFDDYNVVTKIDENGTVTCQSNHLTMFTLKTEPVETAVQNIPLLIAAIPGSVLCAIAVFLLIKAYCMTKLEEMRREEAEEKRLEEWASIHRANAFTYHNSLYEHY